MLFLPGMMPLPVGAIYETPGFLASVDPWAGIAFIAILLLAGLYASTRSANSGNGWNTNPLLTPEIYCELQGLKAVPWKSLKHAYGKASDTPIHLQNLAAVDETLRESARLALGVSIYHQGSIYPAAVPVVGFIVQLLKSPRVADKGALVDLLFSLATGGSWHENHQSSVFFEKERETASFQAKMAEEKKTVEEVAAEIRAHLPFFLELLAHPDPAVRLEVVNLLRALPDQHQATVPKLVERLASESDSKVRARVYFAVGCLDGKAHQHLFQSALSHETDPTTRAILLRLCCWLFGNDTPGAILDEVVNTCLGATDETLKEYRLVNDSEWLADVAVPLHELSPERSGRIFPVYLERFQSGKVVDENLASGLLFLALWKDGKLAPETPLSPMQKQAVLAVAKMAWPMKDFTSLNMHEVLKAFKLPTTEVEMVEYLGTPIR